MRVGLRTRVVLTTSLVLLIGLALGGWVLVRSFSASVVAGAEEQLRLVVYGLLGAADVRDQQLSFASDFAEPRFVLPESGLYALVENTAQENALAVSVFADDRTRKSSFQRTG